MASLSVITPGLLTTVQDLGRWGYQDRGVPVAGPMDPFAHRLANALAGNARHAATLEITLSGPALTCDDDRVMAVSGASFEIAVDGRPVPWGAAFDVSAGAVLQFGRRLAGARAYLAVAGGIDVPSVLGSRATHLMSAMGGLAGRSLKTGDRLPLGSPGGRGRRRSHRMPAAPETRPVSLRLLAGPEIDRFAAGTLERLQSAPYVVGGDSDRTGYRLEGPALDYADGRDFISNATPVGSVQVPPSGHPIMLMADRQTAGGYPKVATVITADLGVAGQLAPGDALSFRACTFAEALAALISRERALMAVEQGGAP